MPKPEAPANPVVHATDASALARLLEEIIRREGLDVPAPGSGAELRQLEAVKVALGKNYIGPESYEKIFGLKVRDPEAEQTLPKGITEALLRSRCPILNDGRTIAETHRLVYVPGDLGGSDFTILKLRTLATEAGVRLGYGAVFFRQDWYDGEAFAKTRLEKGLWVLMPERELPNSRSMTDAGQIAELQKYPEYRTAFALEATTALVMNALQNGNERLFKDCWLRCEDRPSAGRRVYVGLFLADGLYLLGLDGSLADAWLGRGVLRKF